jgi:hypothetical protein
MKKTLLLAILILFAVPAMAGEKASVPAFPEDKPAPDVSGARRLFVVETDAESATDSLNRISGQIDTGFLPTGDSFESEDHYRPGPFGRQEAVERSND